MKTFLVIAALVALYSCALRKEIAAEMVSAELIRIDTVYRNQSAEQILTWRDPYKVEYVTYASMSRTYILGSRMPMLIKR